MQSRVFTIVLALAVSSSAFAQDHNQQPPTAAEAQTFIDHANAELLKLGNDASRAEWIAETDITDDTEATTALSRASPLRAIISMPSPCWITLLPSTNG